MSDSSLEKYGSTSVGLQPSRAQSSKSSMGGRMAICPLIIELPPVPRPRQYNAGACASVRVAIRCGHTITGSGGAPRSALQGLGDRHTAGRSLLVRLGPASTRSTDLPASVALAARAHPDEPAPTTIRSHATAGEPAMDMQFLRLGCMAFAWT